jgi:hypothetical protein
MIWKWILQNLSKMDLKVYFVFLIITSGMWLIMKLSDNYNRYVEVEITIVDIPKGQVLLSKSDTVIKVFVSAEGYKLLSITNMMSNEVYIPYNNFDFDRNSNKLIIGTIKSKRLKNLINKQLGIKVTEKSIEPDSISITLDKLRSISLPIKFDADLETTLGFRQYGQPVFNPQNVLVTGPASLVDTIQFINTKRMKFKDLNNSFSKEMILVSPSPLIHLSKNKSLVNVEIVEFVEGEIEVPVQVKTNIPNIKIKTFPSQIKITYQVAMPDYKNIHDSLFLVSVTIDSIAVLQHKKLIPSIIKMPKGIENLRIEPNKLDFIILK